jgi:hypothetical protein
MKKAFLAGVLGAVLVIALILGVMFIQSGMGVGEVSLSSSSTSSTSSSTGGSSTQSTASSTTLVTSSSSYSGPTGILGVSLTDPPIVPPGVTDVYISYSSIQVHVADAGNEDGWYEVADSGSVDLMSLLNVSLTLGSGLVQTGVFNLVAFNITSATVTVSGVNESAYVPANRINVPIVGGISVSEGNSSGVLVDLSPEVIPYQNGTAVSYVLVPEARSLPIPAYIWSYKLEVKGAKYTGIENQTWVTKNAGKVVVQAVKLSPNSFSITLQNQGTTNDTFSSIVIGQVLPFPGCQVSNQSSVPQGSPAPADDNGSTTTTTSTNSTASYDNSTTSYGNYTTSSTDNYTSSSYNLTSTTAFSNTTTAFSTTNTTTEYTSTSSTMNATNETLSVFTNATSFFGQSGVMVFGTMNPPPIASDFFVNVRVINPAHNVVYANYVWVSPLNGGFNATFTTGPNLDQGYSLWQNGTYLVYAYHDRLVSWTNFTWSGPTPTLTSTSTTTTSSYTNTTEYRQSEVRSYLCSLYASQDRDGLPLSFPVAYFAILGNNTLYPINYTQVIMNNLPGLKHSDGHSSTYYLKGSMLSYTLAPGQSVTFTYNGSIDTLSGVLLSYLPRTFAVPSSLFSINAGQEYGVVVTGPFDARVATLVNATSIA